MSGVTRYYLEKISGNTYSVYEEKVDGLCKHAKEVVLASDHDQVVAEQKLVIEKLKEQRDEYIYNWANEIEYYGSSKYQQEIAEKHENNCNVQLDEIVRNYNSGGDK